MRQLIASVALGALVAGCGAESPKDYGKQLFSDPHVSTADSNPFACSTCHDVTPTSIDFRPGGTLVDVTARPTWWGGTVITLLDAVNQCVTNFMRGNELTPDDEKGRALLVYLQSLSPDATAPAVPITIVTNIVDIPSGDPAMGKMIYDQGCGNCHGPPHTGTGRLSDKVSLIPDDSIAMHGTDPKTGARPVVIEKTRHGKFFNIGGNMPYYSLEILSDAQLGAVLGYLEMFGLPTYVAP
jgi:thiosulfate dehydrogenase